MKCGVNNTRIDSHSRITVIIISRTIELGEKRVTLFYLRKHRISDSATENKKKIVAEAIHTALFSARFACMNDGAIQ
jgi:hypothetical protein